MHRRSSLVYPVTHLPLLHNPLLNAIFNHPNPTKSRLNKISKQLSDHPNRYIILLPDSISLQDYQDLCHDELFVQSHIVQEVLKGSYVSLNNRTYALSKNYIVLPGTELKVKMLSNELFFNFNNYMTSKQLYKIIHIEQPLEVPLVKQNEAMEIPIIQDVEFNQLIREFPLISEKIGEIYRQFFTRLSLKEIKTTEKLIESYHSIITSGNAIFVDNLDKESVTSILNKYPNLDLNKSLFNYIEMNIYDKFWAQLCSINQENDSFLDDNYDNLGEISLNQVDIPGYTDMSMEKLTATEKCLNRSKAELESLNFTNSSEQQCKALVSVFQILANNSEVGADTLIGLLIVTICRSKVCNLNSHLKYIENFSYDNQNYEKGYLGYVISTFSAVLDYISDQKNLDSLKNYSLSNRNCWALFEDSSDYIHTIAELQDLFRTHERGENIPLESVLYSRTEEGQSLLSLAVKSNKFIIFKTVVNYERIYSIEDILKDRNINNLTLLGQAILTDNEESVYELVSIILSSATLEEKYLYFNQCDDNQRNIGHILFDIDLLQVIGPYINWKQRDINSQTPFFAVLRCYDHPQYEELVTTVIGIVKKWYSNNNIHFDYRDHSDSKNNTLLHVIKCNLALLLNSFENLNLNELNNKNLTPLMYYIKYNRARNVHDILKDPRLDLAKLDGKYYLSALDYAKVDIKSLIHNHEHYNSKSKVESPSKLKMVKDDKENREIELMVDQAFMERYFPIVENKSFGITRIKSDNVNFDLCLFFKTLKISDFGEQNWITNIHNLRDYYKLLQILKVENPQLLISTDYISLIPIYPSQSLKLNNFYKYQSQKFAVILNLTNKVVLNNFSNSQILDDFLLKPGNIKEKKLLNQLNHQSLQKPVERILSGELVEEEVVAMKHFLNYSLEQLVEFEHNIDSFLKMLIFVNVKFDETEYVHSHILKNFKMDELMLVSDDCIELLDDLKKVLSESTQRCNNFTFVAGHKLILFMCQELITTIRKTLTTKLVVWDEHNKAVTRIDNEIRRLHSIDGKSSPPLPQVKRRPSHIVLGEPQGVSLGEPQLNQQQQQQQQQQLAIIDTASSGTPPSSSSNSFLFSSIVQTRKSRDLKIERLTEKKMSSMKRLEIMGNELREEHEFIALKLNNFLSFKKKFTTHQFKDYTENVIRDMKFRLKLLEK